jgi:SAM-dependent methyltransferase
MDSQTHWEALYTSNAPDTVSWYSPHLGASLALIQRLAPPPARVLDAGAGASTLIDDLLQLGYTGLTAIDLSATALETVKQRLGPDRTSHVQFLAADVCTVRLPAGQFDLWHDRAVFHFLTSPVQRSAYVAQATHALKPHAHIVLSTFGPHGPTRCSGLDVLRYDASTLAAEFSPHFSLLESTLSTHRTPTGASQQYLTCVLEKP